MEPYLTQNGSWGSAKSPKSLLSQSLMAGIAGGRGTVGKQAGSFGLGTMESAEQGISEDLRRQRASLKASVSSVR